ncbi:MAG: PAS domain-containing protein, partial [Planctomycetia bacterium]|nr:PAS domain-containing protein [Planctomycetia bacterium]
MEDRQAICVLVVEDDPEDAMILRRHLGRVATFCVSVERILDWEGSKGADNFQRYDVIFLDYRLSGGVTGLDALREIREKDSYFPVIILTGSGDEEIAVEIMKAGATDYIVKESLSPQLLGKALSHALDARATAQEKARLDDALRQSEERYRTLVNSVTEYLYSVKVEDGRAVPVLHSQSCSQITGYSPGDYENNPGLWLEMVLPEDRPRVMEHFRRLMRGEAVEPIEHRIIHKDAEVRWVRNSAVPRFDEKGELTGY